MRKINFIILAVTSILLLNGCSLNQLTRHSDSPTCETTIEGNYFSKSIYKYDGPAILFPWSNSVSIRHGKVIRKDSTGVLFLQNKIGLFGSFDTLYFNYNKIRAIIDSNNLCTWGHLDPKEEVGIHMEIELSKYHEPDYSPIYLDLFPNSKFSYCIKPGKYEITRIIEYFPYKSGEVYYESVPKHIATFEIKRDSANYIGDIRLLDNKSSDKASLVVACKNQITGKTAGFYGGFIGGFIGGAIAGTIVSIENASADSSGVFRISLKHDKEYEPQENLRLNNTIVKQIHQMSKK